MDQRLLRILGGETKFYPYLLESKYPRILAQIMMLWDEPGMSDYFMELMVSDREDRSGFPPDVAAEIIRLSLVHASSHKPHKKPDIWEVSANKFSDFRPPVSIAMSNVWKPLSDTTTKALKRFGIPGSARGFHSAAETGNRPAVALFLEARVNTEIHNERGWTPLMLAAFNGHNEVIRTLIKHNANVHASDLLGNTALHWAVSAGQTSSAKLLIENRAGIDACNHSGMTPLFQATIHRRLGDVLLLIDSGANLNLATRDGSTALHKAAAEGYTEIVRTLLHHGADTSIKNLDGSLPLALAAKNDRKAVIKILMSNSKAG
jgi:ankyrin repeat protein